MTGWRILCGGLVFTAVTTVAAAGLAALGGRLDLRGAWIALALGALAGAVTAQKASAPRQKITRADTILFIVFALAAFRAFVWVIYEQGNELKILSPHNLGDTALHLNLIVRWANGGAFWPDNPFLAGAAFAYHPGMDLWNAVLRTVGVPVYEGLRWTGLLGAAAAAAALWRWGRGFALAAFLFAGGLGAWALVQDGTTDIMQSETQWKNLFLTMLVTQRGLLFSLPAVLVLMTVWRAQLSGTDGPRLPLMAQVALYAAMPFFNAPAFLFLSVLLAACFAFAWSRGLQRPFLVVGLVSVMPATWLARMVTAGFTAGSAFRFDPGWMQEDGGLWFWLWNFGIFLPLVAVLGIVLFRRDGTDRTERVFFGVAAGTLLFSFTFLLAPWPWDNTKLMIWGYLALAPLLWDKLLAPRPVWWQAAACLLLFASGAVALVTGLDARHGYKLADRTELADLQVMLRGMPVNARLACAPQFDHPAMLLGQPVVMGHDGHLFSQGLDYSPVERELDTLMNGAPAWRDAARRLQVQYLLWGEREKKRWPLSPQPWQECATLVSASGGNKLYFLTPCLIGE
ncbi:MAG: hypothetical protein WEB31_03150 [Chthoniobacterales bacterium]